MIREKGFVRGKKTASVGLIVLIPGWGKPIQRHPRPMAYLVATVESLVEAFHPQVPVSLPGLVRRVPCTERSHSARVNENKMYATNTGY
jgi:hypothetical protein